MGQWVWGYWRVSGLGLPVRSVAEGATRVEGLKFFYSKLRIRKETQTCGSLTPTSPHAIPVTKSIYSVGSHLALESTWVVHVPL